MGEGLLDDKQHLKLDLFSALYCVTQTCGVEHINSFITTKDYFGSNNMWFLYFLDAATLTFEEILKKKVYTKVTGTILKVRVDADDLVSNALAFYKRSDFDTSLPIRVYFNGQPAVDTGGVKRQFSMIFSRD